MGNLTKNLSREEFYCKCGTCTRHAADHGLVETIQKAADYFAGVYNRDRVVVVVTSGNRCENHNRNVGGAEDSKHLYGIAADFYIKDVPIRQLYQFLEQNSRDSWGLGRYNTWVHLDMRPEKARWIVP